LHVQRLYAFIYFLNLPPPNIGLNIGHIENQILRTTIAMSGREMEERSLIPDRRRRIISNIALSSGFGTHPAF
jgi:hypothetical protein